MRFCSFLTTYFGTIRPLRKQFTAGFKLYATLQKSGISDELLRENLHCLDRCLETKAYDEAALFAERVADRLKEANSRPLWRKFLEFVGTVIAAICIAGVVRQTWFELYEIPTGSMRPTFKEKDRVLVSKSTFGVNIPFTTGHIAFDQNRLKRGAVAVITAENLDVPDVDTLYFGLFPGKKRYVKRLVGLPGDWVYFYGGDLFCLSAEGTTIQRLQSDPNIPKREYLPFLGGFEGRVETITPSPFSRQKTYLLKHFNQPIGRVTITPDGSLDCRIPQDGEWVHEFTPLKNLPRPAPRCFGEFWGMNNFAKCRLLLPNQLPEEAMRLGYQDPSAVAWLELHHSPTLPPQGKTKKSSVRLVNSSTTWIPLRAEHCERIKNSLYTARFNIQNNHLSRYYFEPTNNPTIALPKTIPNGIYEFYNGKGLEIGIGGLASSLPETHPLYPTNTKELAFLFNTGIDVIPECLSGEYLPTRFAYFKDGDLYVMGASIFKKEDPILRFFTSQEITRQAKDYSYFAFQDMGSPTDPEFIKTYGYKVPDHHYLLLGDNPAMSLDCRFFGPVPEDNIQGTTIFLFWPLGPRWGVPEQPFLFPSVYSIVFMFFVFGGMTAYHIRQQRIYRKKLAQFRLLNQAKASNEPHFNVLDR